MSTPVEAWHFLCNEGTLGYPPYTKVEPGQTLVAYDRPINLCYYGLHASRRILDALAYAPGTLVCRVRLFEKIKEGDDKLCATRRTCLWMADADRILNEFSIWCARYILEKAGIKDPSPLVLRVIDRKEKWMQREINSSEFYQIVKTARCTPLLYHGWLFEITKHTDGRMAAYQASRALLDLFGPETWKEADTRLESMLMALGSQDPTSPV